MSKGREWVLLAKHYDTDSDFRAAVENALVDIFPISFWGGRGVMVAPLRVQDGQTYVTVGFVFEEVWMPAVKAPGSDEVEELLAEPVEAS
jgi:hypothetical protein